MTFGELKTYLRNLINRKDITDALAAQFINQAIDRLGKSVRPPFLQTTLVYAPTDASYDSIAIPADFLELMNLFSSEAELEQVDMSTLVKRRACGGSGKPTCFAKIGGDFLLYPSLAAGDSLTLQYNRVTARLLTDDDSNGWTFSAIDCIVYAAAELAADFYEDDRGPRFAEKYSLSLVELQNQIYEDAFSGPMAVQPAYRYAPDY